MNTSPLPGADKATDEQRPVTIVDVRNWHLGQAEQMRASRDHAIERAKEFGPQRAMYLEDIEIAGRSMDYHNECAAALAAPLPAAPAPIELAPGTQNGVDYLMDAVQCYADEWRKLSQNPADPDEARADAEGTKRRIRDMLEHDARKLAALSARQAKHECAMCNDTGIVGRPPDDYFDCPDCVAARQVGAPDTSPAQGAGSVDSLAEELKGAPFHLSPHMAYAIARHISARLARTAAPSGQWVRCTPNLILAGIDCGNTPRRWVGDNHEHFIAHAAAPSEPQKIVDVTAYTDEQVSDANRAGKEDRAAAKQQDTAAFKAQETINVLRDENQELRREWEKQAETIAALRDELHGDPAPSEGQAIPTDLTSAATAVLAERKRQQEVEGWTMEHDDEHAKGDMARAAAAYAIVGSSDGRNITDDGSTPSVIERLWPWDWSWFKPKDRRRNLVKAGALLIAEIERIDRGALAKKGQP